jgi:hypothetical protein
VLEGVNDPPEVRLARGAKLNEYCAPRSTTTSSTRARSDHYLLDAELGGRKLDPFHVAGTMTLLLIAGIDTPGAPSALAVAPGEDPGRPGAPGRRAGAAADRDRGVPAAFAPVTMARLVKQDMHWRGWT